MQKIFVTGHRNPDMDSVCASWAYARLKNHLNQQYEYHPVRCGHLNTQTKETFRELGIEAPELEKDVSPRVKDIIARNPRRLGAEDPILDAVQAIHDYNISILPIFNKKDQFVGLVSINEVSDFLISEQIGERPHYTFDTTNFEKVLPGFCYKRGDRSQFKAAVMIGAMPFEVSVERINELLPDKPILVVGQRTQILEYAVRQQFPAVILTGVKDPGDVFFDFRDFKGTVFVSRTDTAETVRLLRLSSPISGIMGNEYPELTEEDHFDDAKDLLVHSELRGLPVFSADETPKFVGVVTRRCFIDRPRRKVIMVDHNEASQSIRGIEHADIVEIIDHHRLGAEKTRMPIYIAARPVGSTCTIVYQHYLQEKVPLDESTAQVLLAGLLSDTVILKSPTTTAEDLALITGSTVEGFGEMIFKHTATLSRLDPREVIEADFKEYHEGDFRVGIGQVEVSTFQNLEEVLPVFLDTLQKVGNNRDLDWTLLLISNVFREHSKLLCTPFPKAEEKLVFKAEHLGVFDLPEILSRKKQVLPEILRVLEELKGKKL